MQREILCKRQRIPILCSLVVLATLLGALAGCHRITSDGGTTSSGNPPASSCTDQTDKSVPSETKATKEERIAAYIKAKDYEAVPNSGVGYRIYVPKKDREDHKAFFDHLNRQSRLNGYDFAGYLDKPLDYAALAINSPDATQAISFLCFQEQIVGVWTDSSPREQLAVTQKLLPYNFVYNAEELLSYQSACEDDNRLIADLIYALPYINGVKPTGYELPAGKRPYGIIIHCEGYGTDASIGRPYFKNAAVIFSLIGYVDVVTFNIKTANGSSPFQFTRQEIEEYFQQDVRNCTHQKARFEEFIMAVQDADGNSSN